MSFFKWQITIKDILILISVTLFLLFSAEFIASKLVDRKIKRNPELNFLRQEQGKNFSFLSDCCSYNEVDPLLGWAMSAEQLKAKGWTIKNNCIFLENKTAASKDTVVIFITGGSTSDLGLNSKCWPFLLLKLLKEKNISAQIYVGAVGAYGSSQEVLKLIRDGIKILPDIHISYSGANEYQNPYFVSPYEQTFYNEAMRKNEFSPVLPNTIFLIKDLLHLNKNKLQLKPLPSNNATQQWKENLSLMNSIAVGNQYQFIGILQPVVGFGKIVNSKTDPDILNFLEEYKKFYPSAIQHTNSTYYLNDFTGIFDNYGEKVFIDDCHIKDEYQQIIADSVYSLIERKEIEMK